MQDCELKLDYHVFASIDWNDYHLSNRMKHKYFLNNHMEHQLLREKFCGIKYFNKDDFYKANIIGKNVYKTFTVYSWHLR